MVRFCLSATAQEAWVLWLTSGTRRLRLMAHASRLTAHGSQQTRILHCTVLQEAVGSDELQVPESHAQRTDSIQLDPPPHCRISPPRHLHELARASLMHTTTLHCPVNMCHGASQVRSPTCRLCNPCRSRTTAGMDTRYCRTGTPATLSSAQERRTAEQDQHAELPDRGQANPRAPAPV